jgi:hypothetical protein
MSATVHYLPTARPGLAPRRGAEPDDDWAADAHGVLDAVEELLATGRTADVVAFCELAVAFLEANACDIEDPTPLVRLARRLGDLQRRAEPRSPLGPGPRRPSGRSWPSRPSGRHPSIG